VWQEDTLGAEFQEVSIPEDLLEEASHRREILIEALAEHDDALMEKYLSETPIEIRS